MAKKSESSNSWHSIDQSSARISNSEVKKRRFTSWLRLVVISFSSFAFISILIISIYFLNKHFLPRALTPFSSSITDIHIQTNGVLTKNLIVPFLDLPKDSGILNIDIFALKQKLQTIPQVQSAVAEREFPNRLKITLTEHIPILKLIALNKKGQKEGLLISADGHVFKGHNYPSTFIKNLLYLKGVAPKRLANNQFKQMPFIPKIAELIKEAREKTPEIYTDWKFIIVDNSFELIQNNTENYYSYIKVLSFSGMEIIFAPKDFSMQLERLDAIITFANTQHLSQIERIDLSLDNQVAVKVARNSLNPN